MKKVYILFALFLAFCLIDIANLYAQEYVKDDEPKVDDNGYIMSWLILEPYIKDNIGSPQSTIKDYFEDQGGEANIRPKEGDKVKIKETNSSHEWVRLNFADLKDMGLIGAAVGGNELDISGRMVDYAQDYLVTYIKYDKDTSITFTVGADDGGELYCNGELILQNGIDKDWAAGNCGSGKASVKGGKWNVIVVGCYETGGEWGISVQVNPIPDEVDSSGPDALFTVEPAFKLTATWGEVKVK